MGIYDRDYYRREGPSFLGSLSDRGQVCRWLIIINVAVFILQVLSQQPAHWDEDGFRFLPPADPVTDLFALSTQKVMEGQVWRLLTCAFLHGSLWHLFFNMLFLFWFGSDVEDLYSSKEFLAFYISAALASSLAYVGWQLVQGDTARAIGASGAVTAVMVVCALHYPSRIIYMSFFIPVPIWFFVLFQVVQDSYIFVSGIRTGVAVTGHLGGAAFGFVYHQMQWRMLNVLPSIRTRYRARSRARLRVFRGEEEAAAVPLSAPANPVDEQLEAKLDAVLEKMNRVGEAGLSDSERALLLRAAEVFKKRRS